MGCKRITPSDDYVAAYSKPCVKLVTDKIETFTKDGIRTVDQTEHKFEAVLFATGFDLLKTANPFTIIGTSEKNQY